MYIDKATKDYLKLKGKTDTIILGIESSCDETAAAVTRGTEVLSDVISSQIELHRRFGGVVPEAASRNHTMAINSVVEKAISDAGINFSDIDAVAVTYGAGLLGALLIGVTYAKALAFAIKKPLIMVNHIEAHISANYIESDNLEPSFLAVVASGGHTNIIEVNGYNDFAVLGGTVDDAIGEAFDKVARLLGLPYPGGPEIDRLARNGKAVIEFYKKPKNINQDLSLSYSGLKTAVVNYIHTKKQNNEDFIIEDVCASFTETAVNLLVDTAVFAAKKTGKKRIVLAGGVASNSYLREKLSFEAEKQGLELSYPKPRLCTDNACMVAVRGYHSAFENKNLADLKLNAESNLRIENAVSN